MIQLKKADLFKRNWDVFSVSITIICVVIILITTPYLKQLNDVILIFLGLLLIIIVGVLLFLFPKSYIVNEKFLIINKYFLPSKYIKISDILEIQKISSQTYKTMNVSTQGVFGYLGIYMDGTISMATSLKNNVFIKTNTTRMIISPRKSELFIQKIERIKEDTVFVNN